jgi:hypothetical protein
MAKENEVIDGQQAQADPRTRTLAEEASDIRVPRWREILRQAMNQARKDQPVTSRRELGRDRTWTLLILVAAIVAILLFFFSVFSRPSKSSNHTGRSSAPDLGRRTTPGQQNLQAGSATPLLNAQNNTPATQDPNSVTPEDVERTAQPSHAAPPAPKGTPNGAGPYALGRIDFSDSAPQPDRTRQATTTSEAEGLRKPSLVFARSAQNATASPEGKFAPSLLNPSATNGLPTGTRLVARLQSVVSSVVKTPIIAAVEYNYEQGGEIAIPAGTKVIGSLQQADRSGYVAIRFDTLEMPDGTIEKIDATAMSLTYGPLKGDVSGKRTGTRFLVRTLTGMGTLATYLVGAGGGNGFNGPLSESALLRDRIANNVGIAGDQELNNLAFNQNIIVTVPANTRLYVVIGKELGNAEPPVRQPITQSTAAALPTVEDLRQLMELRREMSEMYRQGGGSNPSQPIPQQ